MKNSILFNLKLNDHAIEKAGKKSSSFLRSHGFSNETVKAQIKILRELIHNGKKFDNPSSAKESEMSVFLLVEDKSITVEIRKVVEESSHRQLIELDKTIQWIRGYQDPFEPYMQKVGDISENLNHRETNSIGLARIAYEAGAILDFFVNEDNVLNLSAVRNLNGDCRG